MNEKLSSHGPIGWSLWTLRVGMLAAILATSCHSELETTEKREEQALAQLSAPPPPDDLVKTIGADEVIAVAEQVADLYRPAAATHHGSDITILSRWDNPEFSIAPKIDSGRHWKVYYSGGILTEHCTRDTVRWGTCHEMGHFFGGFPFNRAHRPVPSIDEMGTFISTEGMADYFSSKDCLRRVWNNDPNNAAFRDLVPPEGQIRCDAAFPSQEDRDICYRSIVVAKKAMLWATYVVDITTPASTVVERTVSGHPGGQCRFDTIVEGAVCGAPSDLSVIPGLLPAPWNGLYGVHSVPSEQASKPYACHSPNPGARPACWFKADYPDTFNCNGIPSEGICEGDWLLACDLHDGFTHEWCTKGCIIVSGPAGEHAECAPDPPSLSSTRPRGARTSCLFSH